MSSALLAIGVAAGIPVSLPGDVPVDPDGPTAHDWLQHELAKGVYQTAADPLQKLISQFQDWLDSLRVDGSGPPSAILLSIVIALIAGVLVAAFFIFGLPRLNRRSSVSGALFGEHDERDAAAMRRDAERAAAAGDFGLAIAELFRSIARGLAERAIVTSSPGTTAHEFARQAGVVFPDSAAPLASAATVFDGVRYLDLEGTKDEWMTLVALERTLRSARPAFAESAAVS